jgi:replicative DNA helicase
MFSLNVADNVAKDYKVAIFELEMSAEKLGARRLAAKSLINATKLPRGDMSSEEWVRLGQRASEIATRNNMFTDTTPGITMAEIRAKCKKIKLKYGLDVVVIDHLGLLTPGNSKESRVQQVSEITRQGKILAKDLDLVVIMLSQLSRACEQRNDKRPMLSDLRESGSIEQDADLAMFMYRDEYYNKESEKKGILECIIAKQRDGRTGTLEFSYMSEYQRITEKPF